MNADSRVMAFFPKVLTRAESDGVADRIEAAMAEQGWGFWAVEIVGGERFIGFVGLNVPMPSLPFSPSVEIGWRLAFPFWGKGYASEAATGALRVAFEILHLPEIVAFTTVRNRRSRAVMERLGMREDGEFEHPGVPPGSPLRQHCLYRLSSEQWCRALA